MPATFPAPLSTPTPALLAALHDAWLDPARADAVALADDQREWRYPELHAAVGGAAGRLRQAGIRRGDRVALAMARSAELAVAILAVMAAGACPCPLEPQLGAEETARRYRIARLDWTVCDAGHSDDPAFACVPPERMLPWQGLPAAAAFWDLAVPPESDAFLLFTSGSSGKPKGVLQSHLGMATNAQGVIAHTALAADDRLLHVMPLHHTNGVNNQLVAPLLAGASVWLAARFRADDMPALMARHRPTIVTGVPTIYSRMLAHEFAPESLAALRMLRCGSAPITEELHRRIEAKFGLPLVVSYGLSEATCTSTMNPPGSRRIGSVGTPLAGQDVFLAGADGQRLTAPGAQGEICIAGPILMLGYLDESADGHARPPGAVLHSGDLGRFDEQGYLYITGRIKDVIIRGGENLSPNLIEEALATLPGVSACCVVGQPDADLGEVPVAFIVRQAGHPGTPVQPAELDAAVLARLSRIHRPARYHFVESMPENSTGKIDRRRLAATLQA